MQTDGQKIYLEIHESKRERERESVWFTNIEVDKLVAK